MVKRAIEPVTPPATEFNGPTLPNSEALQVADSEPEEQAQDEERRSALAENNALLGSLSSSEVAAGLGPDGSETGSFRLDEDGLLSNLEAFMDTL
jgi:hypothetical protein